MSEMRHTPEPWRNWPHIGATFGPDGKPIMTAGEDCPGPGGEEGRANAERIPAAINAVAGIPTASLTPGIVAELVAACEGLLASASPSQLLSDWFLRLRAALASIKGESR